MKTSSLLYLYRQVLESRGGFLNCPTCDSRCCDSMFFSSPWYAYPDIWLGFIANISSHGDKKAVFSSFYHKKYF